MIRSPLTQRRLCLRVAMAAAVAMTLGAGAQAQGFPAGPVRITTPMPAGSGPDAAVRVLADKLGKLWGQQVLVDNKPGANGLLALKAFKGLPANGQELLVADLGHLAINPALYRSLPYDPVKDLAPVSNLYRVSFFIAVGASSPYKTLRELLAAAATPDKLSYASNGAGSPLHLSGAMLDQALGTQMLHVPFKEASAMVGSVVGGDVSWFPASLGTAGPLLRAGKLRFLAIADAQRSPQLPEVPTLAEAGGPKGVAATSWVALLAPAGTPPATLLAINQALAKVMQQPEVQERFAGFGFTPALGTPEQLAEMIRVDTVRYAELVKRTGARAD